MLKISWTEKVTNEEMLVSAKETGSIFETIWHRKHRWLRHVLRHENFLHAIIEGNKIGKTTRRRKRMELLHDIMDTKDYGQLTDLISDRSRW